MKLFRQILSIFLACEFVAALMAALVLFTENRNRPSFWPAFLFAHEAIGFAGILGGGLAFFAWISGIFDDDKK